MVARIALVSLLFASLAVAGCGSDTDNASGTTGSGGSGGGGAPGTGGTGNAGGSGGDGAGIVSVEYPFGTILAEADEFDGAAESSIHAAFFTKATVGCNETTMGVCTFSDCTGSKAPSLVSAGDIKVTGADQAISISPAADKSYTFDQMDAVLWAGGKKLTFKASGAAVPAFTIAATAPPLFTLTDPDVEVHPTISRAKDLDVTWEQATGSVQMLLVKQPSREITLNCTFDAAPGKGTVPKEMLSKLPGGDDWIALFRDAVKVTTMAADWKIELEIVQIGQTPDGAGSVGEVAVQ